MPHISYCCECSSGNLNNQDPSSNPNIHRSLLDLYFCPSCQAIRCDYCTDHEIITKYCPHCLTFTNSDTNICSRNCFTCPFCDSNVIITSTTVAGSKSFVFKCCGCYYKYNSGPLSKPKSLTSFIRAQTRSQQFSLLQKNHILRGKGARDYKELVAGLSKENSHELTEEFDEDQDLANVEVMRSASLESVVSYNQFLKYRVLNSEGVSSIKASQERFQTILPVPRKLRSLKRKRCRVCKEALSSAEAPKFAYTVAHDAVDYLPSVKIHFVPAEKRPGATLSYVLAFSNPYFSKGMHITLSTFDSQHNLSHAKVILPCNNFKLGKLSSILNDFSTTTTPNSESDSESEEISDRDSRAELNQPKTFVKTIPTFELTNNTSISRIEKLARNSAQNSVVGVPTANSPSKNSYNIDVSSLNPITNAPYLAAHNISKHSFSSQESLPKSKSASVDTMPLDYSANWCCVGMSVTLPRNKQSNFSLNVPIYVTVEKEVKQSSPFSFWIVTHLGEMNVEDYDDDDTSLNMSTNLSSLSMNMSLENLMQDIED